MQEIISQIASLICKFNKENNLNLQIFLKGSYLFWKENFISRKPNDLDLGFVNCSFSQRQEFINFILQEENAELIKKDDNLQVLRINGFIIDFIVLETINKQFLKESQYKNLYELKIMYAFFQKITMIGYVLSPVFPHDSNKKMLSIIDDLNISWNILSKNPDNINYQSEKNFFQNSLWNSFFIYWFYNYDKMLDKYFDFLKLESYNNYFDQSLKNYIYNFLTFIKEQFKSNLDFFDKMLKNKQIYTNMMVNFLNFPLIPGFEKRYIEKLFGDNIHKKTNGGYLSKNNKNNNVLFINHSDEVGGIAIAGEVFNQGTTYFDSGVFEIFDQNSEKINEISCVKIDNLVFSEEKSRKINRPNLKCFGIPENGIYQVLPKSEVKISGFTIFSRNQDNKISNILARILLDIDKNLDILLTTKEEIQLQGTKDFFVTNQIKKYKFLVNIDVCEDQNWDNEGIKIRVDDTFTAHNIVFYNKIVEIFQKNSIPFRPYFGSGWTDITNFQNQNAITLSIPASKIHSNSSMSLIKNFFFLLWICKEINDNIF
ncbi:M28 family peptidase [Mesomycoplasma ovipneumoniae]|uniref:M28 family peptidase n=1 Tax=Mesomycoplasma ovipneumoniae TaxID=29562 RepID=UPI00307FDCD8